MTTTLLWILIVLAAGTLVLTFVLLVRGRSAAQGNLEQVLRAELRTAREESSSHARGLREEVSSSQTKANELLVKTVNALGQSQTELLDKVAGATRESRSPLAARSRSSPSGSSSHFERSRPKTSSASTRYESP